MNLTLFKLPMWLAVLSLLIFIVIALLSIKTRGRKGVHPYQRLNALFTPAERSFYGILSQAIGDDALIFGKVRVADVLTPQKSTVKGVWQTAFNKISAKHFDFVLCRKDDLSFLCAIELDDRSHNRAKRQLRDAFLEEACQSAAFPLIRFPAKSGYQISDVRTALNDYLSNSLVLSEISDVKQGHKKSCPNCASEMKLRVAKKGNSVGNEFWGCSVFPKCRHMEQMSA